MLTLALACGTGEPDNEPISSQDLIPTPDRAHILVIDDETPAGFTAAAANSAYRQGYAHMQAAAWYSVIAAYDEAIHIQPTVSGLYEARGTAYMYADRHDQALADYSTAIDMNPNDAGNWHRRVHAYTIAPTPQPERGIEDATRAIKLEPEHPMGYGHRAIAYTRLPTTEWSKALADMDHHIGTAPINH